MGIQNFSLVSLPIIACALLKFTGPTTTTAFNCQVTNLGAGAFQIDINEPLPYGSYIAAATPITSGASAVTISAIIDISPTRKKVTLTGDVADCSFILYALPID